MKNKNILWKVILIIGILPYIIALSYAVYSAITGFSALCILNCIEQYGIPAFIDSLIIYSVVYWPTYVIGIILIALSIIKMRILKNKSIS